MQKGPILYSTCAWQTAFLFSTVQVRLCSCSVVQDEGLVCGRGADSNVGLSVHGTIIYL